MSVPKEPSLNPIANATFKDVVVVEFVDPEVLKTLCVNKSGFTFMHIRT